MGHISRCLGLAQVLRDKYADEIQFYLFESSMAAKLVRSKGFKVIELASGELDDLQSAQEGFGAQVWVIDERKFITLSDLLKLKANGAKVALIDDLSDKRLNADLLFYPPIPQVKQLSWDHFLGERYTGWEWVLLKPEFSYNPKQLNSNPSHFLRILITLGGSDPWGFTPRVLGCVDSIDHEFEINVVINSGFLHYEELNLFLRHHSFAHPITISKDPSDMRQLMLEANLAIASFGVTAYELAATGVPSVLICPTKDHLQSASIFESSGLGSIVDASALSHREPKNFERQICEKVCNLLVHSEILMNMSRRSRDLCLRDGVHMIAAKLHEIYR
jgi:spore coat polysaccharide biosynthesis protein SpsF